MPGDCIYEGDRKLYINPGERIDCGASAAGLPEGAIFLDFKAPADMTKFVMDNQRFFAEALEGREETMGNSRAAAGRSSARWARTPAWCWSGEPLCGACGARRVG